VRPRLAAVLIAVLAVGMRIPDARAQETPPFEVLPSHAAPHPTHRLALLTALVGVGCIAASFPLATEADHRYEVYLAETDVTQIDARYDATTRMDYVASGTLIAGEALLATAVWLRFLHPPRETSRVSLEVEPARCAVSLRF